MSRIYRLIEKNYVFDVLESTWLSAGAGIQIFLRINFLIILAQNIPWAKVELLLYVTLKAFGVTDKDL